MDDKKRKEENDEDARVSPLGLFNYAESYWTAASHLNAARLTTSHSEAPVRFLYYHAIELYLKAFLHSKFVSSAGLKQYGHNVATLSKEAAERGLGFDDEDKEILAYMTNDALLRSRYIKRGKFEWAAIEALERLCRSLRESVGAALRECGVSIR